MFAYTELGHAVERHVAEKSLDTQRGEQFVAKLVNGFPYYGLSPVWFVFVVLGVITVLVAYSLVGKGRGSHAGREEVRRAYRRKLAQEMAKEDAAKIRSGEKPRRRWMQW